MKATTLFTFLFFAVLSACGQNVQPGQLISARVAKRMMDTLYLNADQYRSIYQANINLLTQKSAARQRYTNRDSLTIQIQRIENRRDTLYSAVLKPEQYQVYKQKKMVLISAQ